MVLVKRERSIVGVMDAPLHKADSSVLCQVPGVSEWACEGGKGHAQHALRLTGLAIKMHVG